MKRAVFLIVVIVALWAQSASADLAGSRHLDRDNRRCAKYGQHYARNGYTAHELAHMDRLNCKLVGSVWMTALYYTAEEE